MSSLLGSSSSLQGALPIFIDAALKGALLVGVAALGAYALRKRSAASRHAVWTAAVIGHLAIPVLIFILPAWTMPVLPAAPWMRQPASISTATPPSSFQTSSVAVTSKASGPVAPAPKAQTVASKQATEPGAGAAATPRSINPTVTSRRPSTAAIVAMIWFFGAVLVLLRLALGTWKVGQLAREGSRVEDGVWLSLTQHLANRLGVSRPMTLLRGERLAVPVTWGIVYPAVLLPQDADTWSDERRRFVLVHEMAHVKRFDALTQLLSQFAVALFWFDPLVWIAANQMRVEREHACDDYVLRDGTTPSLYAGELLEMVRSIGTPRHDSAAPAFAALAMARRSEFEGRMLAILDPRLDRQTLRPRGNLMTAAIVAFLALPLAALRPFQQPTPAKVAADEFPISFKVSISDPKGDIGSMLTASGATTPAIVAGAASSALVPQQAAGASGASIAMKPRYSCEAYPVGTVLHGTSQHIDAHSDSDGERWDFLVSESDRCTEAALIGKAQFSADETHIVSLAPGGFARFRERTREADRGVSVIPVGDGSLSYTATLNGHPVAFDDTMSGWLAGLMPRVLREVGVNVPERVARFLARGGVPAVLQEIAQINSGSSKRMHYEELIKHGPSLSSSDAEKIAAQVGRDLTSSGDLSAVLQMLPKSAVQSPGARAAMADALAKISSSGDKASTLEFLAPNADPQMLLLLAKAAESLASSGDKANFLLATASEYLTPRDAALRTAYFRAASTLQSSGDMANVLLGAIPYAHANADVVSDVVDISAGLASSGDAANVLLALVSQRALQPQMKNATMAVIQRTLTMASSGDRANVLMQVGSARLLTTGELRDAFVKAAMALPSDGDRANVLAAVAKQ
jgi:beta-lactamase regulating signal transducer with metallopeptidase domain